MGQEHMILNDWDERTTVLTGPLLWIGSIRWPSYGSRYGGRNTRLRMLCSTQLSFSRKTSYQITAHHT